jgi:hypothetical protein
MAILNYTTKINAGKTVGEIQEILAKRGVRKIVNDYNDNGDVAALTFVIMIDLKPVGFSLPCNYKGVLRAMQNDKKVPRSQCTEEQALRVSWRILKDWIEAQMAIIDAQLASIDEVFLPYAITKSGGTLYEEIKKDTSKLLTE